ncbi:GNAT family N-acetyltransferase [Longimicrobium sp.]|uniref:GNAT family N-acetyltransferase n=1 Tax=Longimicrobium sp. TaxID=2029185 RepID=UPI002B6C2290|nr:GNAT family N-acetyltransferase [Longimicrobium sp.]HSU17088.1 GNAT family N-acetyltransferase [Longimicrobium sp.]
MTADLRALAPGDLPAIASGIERWASEHPDRAAGLSAAAQAELALASLAADAEAGARLLLAGDADAGTVCGWTPLPWDSEVLGVPSARVSVLSWGGWDDAGAMRIGAVVGGAVREADASGARLLVLRADARDARAVPALEDAGFRLADTLVTFATQRLEAPEDAARGVDAAEERDLDALRRIARGFRTGHFHADPRIPSARAEDVYVRWIENSLAGRADAVLVGRDERDAVEGFITCRMDRRRSASLPRPHGVIELVAADAAAQGRGVGGRLVAAALRWFAAQGAGSAEVGTQIDNLGAVRLYERSGFRIAGFSHTFHRWSP